MKKRYTIHSNLWVYPGGKAAWFFVTVPVDVAQDIDYYFADDKRGWGSLRVTVRVGETSWDTSIFPDKKSGTYLLPVKKEVRRKEDLREGEEVSLVVEVGGVK